jgi:hypothetical protein
MLSLESPDTANTTDTSTGIEIVAEALFTPSNCSIAAEDLLNFRISEEDPTKDQTAVEFPIAPAEAAACDPKIQTEAAVTVPEPVLVTSQDVSTGPSSEVARIDSELTPVKDVSPTVAAASVPSWADDFDEVCNETALSPKHDSGEFAIPSRLYCD